MNRLALLLSLVILLSCQDEIDEEEYFIKHSRDSNQKLICYFPPVASFPGGYDSLRIFVSRNLKYPKQCFEGRVYVEFMVHKNGSISDTKIIKGLSERYNKSALDVFSKMPRWIPGEIQGKPVKTKMIYPITFTI